MRTAHVLGISALALLMSAAAAQTGTAPTPKPRPEGTAIADANTQQARNVIDKGIQALGGEAYLAFRSMYQEGRLSSFYRGSPRGVGVPFFRTFAWPDKERIEFFKQRDWIIVHNGDKGWETTFHGTRAEDAKDLRESVKRRHYSLENVLRTWINEPGVMLFYDGLQLVEGRQTHKVTIMNARNENVSLFFDVNDYLPAQKTFVFRDPFTNDRYEEGEIYANYKLVDGIHAPLSITRSRDGEMQSQRFIRIVRFNVPTQDAMFTATVTYDPKKRNLPRDPNAPPK